MVSKYNCHASGTVTLQTTSNTSLFSIILCNYGSKLEQLDLDKHKNINIAKILNTTCKLAQCLCLSMYSLTIL